MPVYVYIDESGNLGFHPDKSSKYLIITALFVSDYSKLDRIIKNMRQGTFKKEFKKNNEIKGNKSPPPLKKKLLKKLNEIQDIRIIHIIFEKKKLQDTYLIQNKNELYNRIAGEITKNIPFENIFLEIRIDKSKGKQLLRDEFDHYFKQKFEISNSCHLQNNMIFHSDSTL